MFYFSNHYLFLLDAATGELREVVAHKVGGEVVFAHLIQYRKAIAYMTNGIQVVRLVQHHWSDTHGIQTDTNLGGSSDGTTALGGMTLESLTEMFASGIEEAHQHNNEILDISDARSLRAHTDGISLARTNIGQLALMNAPSVGGDVECWLIVCPTQTGSAKSLSNIGSAKLFCFRKWFRKNNCSELVPQIRFPQLTKS